ncbi:MAG: DUF4317 domain-containing protein [Clostridiales bacterium]|nr:DUF4317 domain-containing protein [Clostridiales bacterium]
MNKKDILELKRRYKKEACTFTKLCGCYVNSEKEKLVEFKETFFNIPDVELHKYLDISKKVLSGGVGNNLLELNFPTDENFENDKQNFLMRLKGSALKDDVLLREFYDSIIVNFDYAENYLILVFHDVYDVMTKTSDNIKLDESEESYEYIMCAICPVSKSKPGLGYFDTEQKIKARIRDWVVGVPTIGFVYPGFIDRSSDVNAIMYYTKNAKDPHPELMENTLGCLSKQTSTIQKETFQSIVKSTISSDDEISEKVFIDIQENLNTMIEEHKELYEGTTITPIVLSKDKVKDLLIDSGVSEEATKKIEESYEMSFGEDLPLAENLVDSKLIKANAHKKKEEQLIKQVESLENKLEAVSNNTEVKDVVDINDDVESSDDENFEELNQKNYDVVLHVKPSILSKIKTEVIDGQRCIVVPINDDEQATINGMEDML